MNNAFDFHFEVHLQELTNDKIMFNNSDHYISFDRETEKFNYTTPDTAALNVYIEGTLAGSYSGGSADFDLNGNVFYVNSLGIFHYFKGKTINLLSETENANALNLPPDIQLPLQGPSTFGQGKYPGTILGEKQ